MRTAIQATHVILDTVIILGVSLIPSSLVILKETIPGYNSILLTASTNMNFGLNSEVNRVKREVKEPEPPKPTKVPDIKPAPKPVKIPEKQPLKIQRDDEVSNAVNATILFIPAIFAGILISRI